ncbi:MAG: class I SAM-dependent methyltransferase [Pseudomonadota bacterium]
MNSTDAGTARFWDRIAQRYAAKPVPDEAVYEAKLAMTRERLSHTARLLELGCGTGTTALRLAPQVGHILATDLSPAMIAIASRKARATQIDNVDFECQSAADVRLPAASVDAVLAHSLLHLLENWHAVIANAYRTLRPEGVFVTSTVCLADDAAWLERLAPIGRRLGLLPRMSFFRRSALLNRLKATGFTIEHEDQPTPKRGVFVIARKPSEDRVNPINEASETALQGQK